MSIKPLDMQVMMPKTAEVAKITSDNQHKQQMIAQQQSNSVQKKATDSLKQVKGQDKPHEALIREQQEKKQNRGGQEKKKQQGKETLEKNKPTRPQPRTGIIDIKL